MKLDKTGLNLQELDSREALSINGGESFWYWIFYGIGGISRIVADSYYGGMVENQRQISRSGMGNSVLHF